MKKWMKMGLLLSLAAVLSLAPFPAYAEKEGLSEEEFAKVCEKSHAKSRWMNPPLKNPAEDPFNYEFHYRDVILSPDGEGFIDNQEDMKRDEDLAFGKVLMDMADGYEVSYEHHITDISSDQKTEVVVEGKTITPYYRAVPVDGTAGSGEQEYTYFCNEPEEAPVIPNFPQNYNWKKHKGATLSVSALVTVRSLKDGQIYTFNSDGINEVTNLYKDKPDCYCLAPTEIGTYTVKEGDTLQKIARSYYGNSGQWNYIYIRNRRYIQNPDFIYPGTLLVIPDASLIVPPYIY